MNDALARKLAPYSSERIDVTEDEAKPFPGVTFVRARRVPPYTHFEDSRPRVATAIRADGECTIVTNLNELLNAWPLLERAAAGRNESLHEALMAAIEASGILGNRAVVTSTGQLRERYFSGEIEPPSAADSVSSPTTIRSPSASIVVFYADLQSGLFRYSVEFPRDGSPRAARQLVGAKVAM